MKGSRFVVAEGLNGVDPLKRPRHPPWFPPLVADVKGILVHNSLTECLEVFTPRCGRLVRWYTCGPTVYDVSHMGHARAYLTFDILRRIMEDYFGYKVVYQMNITDIDDKIIKRARISFLLQRFRDATLGRGDVSRLVEFTKEALSVASVALAERRERLSQALPENASSRLRAEREEQLMELSLKEKQFNDTTDRVERAIIDAHFDELFEAASVFNGDLLDLREGHSVTDQGIYGDHARRYERLFFEDMRRLGIRDPDVITRVTEYVPQVVEFVQKIMDNGFAYRGETSIFFDTTAFIQAGHSYPKLKPVNDRNESNTTEAEMAEGEGALASSVAGEKRSPNDFALWKFSKAGEPHWPSPWGPGRPGWHIECSVMASDILGTNLDIHSGGCDLKFPHHDNECAQSEAYNMQHQWVNYFMHCGHLHIKGLKMSKSLKNFITIRHALDELGVTPRTMRLLFLANHWNKSMNFSDQSIDEAKERERVLRAFFGSVDVVLRNDTLKETQGFNENDRKLNEAWISSESVIDEALRNNFDTPAAMEAIMGLVSETNQYLLTEQRPSATLIHKIGRYVSRILQVFGVVEGNDIVGFNVQHHTDDQLVQVMQALLRFRDAVRSESKASGTSSCFLPLCDAVRDEWLASAGIRLEDSPNGPTTWKKDDPVILLREISERKLQLAGDKQKRLQNQIETKKKLLEKWRGYACSPRNYYRERCGNLYAAFDDITGFPTVKFGGEEVGEKERKKLSKELERYTRSHEEFISKGGMRWLSEQEGELADMLEKLKEHCEPTS